LEENGDWYSRLHLGPFDQGSRLQVGTRLRRSLLNDLDQTSIVAIKLEGAIHEFSRLPGVREPVLDVLFRFRKVVLQVPFLETGKTATISFLFSGTGIFFSKDILFPSGIQCRNPEVSLVTLSPGSILRGHLLVQKNRTLGSISKSDQALRLGETWSLRKASISKPLAKKFQKSSFSPWLRLGFQDKTIERVGFRIEQIGEANYQREVLVFEILTNGIISPRQALRESSLLLVEKFLNVAQRTLPFSPKINSLKEKNSIRETFFPFQKKKIERRKNTFTEQTFYDLCNIGFSRLCEPLGLDLRNLDLTKERYREMRNLGFQTLGQLLESLAFEPHIFSPLLKKTKTNIFVQVGPFSFFILFYGKLSLFYKNGRSSKDFFCKH
jgi:DNA-directed RNA polymerase alpha subunit